MNASTRPPVVILAGSDRRRGPVPEEARDLHFVVGYKGADLRLGGRPLVELLLERLQASGAFGAAYVAGPRRVYAGLVPCEVIDTDGHIGENLRAAVERVTSLHGPEGALGFIACDVLPSAAEIAALAGQLLDAVEGGAGAVAPAPAGASRTPLALAVSMIAARGDLGSSGWKPKYRLRPAPGAEAAPFLPGHLGIIRPAMLRMGLLHRLFRLAYQERNRRYAGRSRRIVLRILGTLLKRDALNLARLQPPTLTYSVVRHGLGTFFKWRRGELDVEGLAFGLGAVFVRRRYFRQHGVRCVRVLTSDLVSFAKDLDTKEEFLELERKVTEGMV